MAMAVYGMGVVVAPVIGPTLGGWITDNYSWRWIFLINIPVGMLVAAADVGADLRSALPGAQDAAPRPEDRLHRPRPADHRAWHFSKSCWTKASGAIGSRRT